MTCTTPSTTLTATGSGSFVWNNGATQNDVVTPSSTTTYTVTVTATNGCTATASKIVTVDKTAPTANAGADATVTCASPSTTLMATGNGAFAWDNGATQGSSVSPSVTTTYTVTVTAANGCTASDAVLVTSNKNTPSLNAGADVSLNCTSPSTTLFATGTGTFSWNNGASQSATVSPSVTTVYSVTLTSADGCTATAAKTVTVDKTAPTVYNVTGGGNYCLGSEGAAIGLDGSQLGIDYTVSYANRKTTIAGTGAAFSLGNYEAGTYTVVARNPASGCTATMTGNATATSMACLSATLSGTQTITAKDPANLVVTISGGVSPYTMVYNNGTADITINNYISGTNIVVIPTLSTTYTLISLKDAANLNGIASGSAIITVMADNTPPTINSSDDILDACSMPNPLPTSSKPTVTDNATTPPTLTLVSTVNGTLISAHLVLKYTKYFIRTWKATDNNGNTATKTQNVYLRDNVAPVVTCKNPTITVGTADVTITPAMLLNTVTDNCVASPSLTVCRGGTSCIPFSSSVKLPVSLIPAGQTQTTVQVTLKAVDLGNAGYCTAVVTLIKANSMANNVNNGKATAQEIVSDANTSNNAQVAKKQIVSMKCFPNPFSDDLNLNYNLTQDANNVILKVYDNQGRLMTTHGMNAQRAGTYEMMWNLSDLPSGMYHVCLEIDGKCTKMERVIRMQ